MYKCEFSKIIWTDETKTDVFVVLGKDLYLPFPPFIGLNVKSGKFDSGLITHVTWNCDSETFQIGVTQEIPSLDDGYHRRSADAIQDLLRRHFGWETVN